MRLSNIITRNRFLTPGVISVIAFFAGLIWSNADPDSNYAFLLWFSGWIAFLLVVGYYSTPFNSVFGKVAFGFVVIMVTGIVIKIFHLPGGNLIITLSLAGLLVTYLMMWIGKKK